MDFIDGYRRGDCLSVFSKTGVDLCTSLYTMMSLDAQQCREEFSFKMYIIVL